MTASQVQSISEDIRPAIQALVDGVRRNEHDIHGKVMAEIEKEEDSHVLIP